MITDGNESALKIDTKRSYFVDINWLYNVNNQPRLK